MTLPRTTSLRNRERRTTGDVRRHLAGVALSRELIGMNPPGVTHDNLKETTDWYLTQMGA